MPKGLINWKQVSIELSGSEQLVCDHQWKSRFSEQRGSWRLCAKCSKEE